MDHPYVFWADWLSKFYLASEAIQALWIVALAITALGTVWLVVRGLVEMMRLVSGARRVPHFKDHPPHLLTIPAPVMPGLDPGTHALTHARQERRGWPGQARP